MTPTRARAYWSQYCPCSLLDGKPIEVTREHGNEEEDFLFVVYDDKIFAPCGTARADAAECDEFFTCP